MMERRRIEEEFNRVVALLAEGKGNKWLRNRLYDLAVMLENAQEIPEIDIEAI